MMPRYSTGTNTPIYCTHSPYVGTIWIPSLHLFGFRNQFSVQISKYICLFLNLTSCLWTLSHVFRPIRPWIIDHIASAFEFTVSVFALGF